MVWGKTAKGVKREFNISWLKVIAGSCLLIIGAVSLIFYMQNVQNYFIAFLAVMGFGPGVLLVWWGFSKFESRFLFALAKKVPEDANAIGIFAKRVNGKDVPVVIQFMKLEHIPVGARLHYVRNLHQHYYELYNNTVAKKLEPVRLPDKKAFPPELYKLPAVMQPVKDYLEYDPPTMLQKIAPWILLLAISIIGLLMVMTTSNGGG